MYYSKCQDQFAFNQLDIKKLWFQLMLLYWSFKHEFLHGLMKSLQKWIHSLATLCVQMQCLTEVCSMYVCSCTDHYCFSEQTDEQSTWLRVANCRYQSDSLQISPHGSALSLQTLLLCWSAQLLSQLTELSSIKLRKIKGLYGHHHARG